MRATLPEDDNRVMTVRQWAELCSFSLSTANRKIRGPKEERPEITQLSDKRIGITVGAHKRWLKRQAR
jgi:hypothetical protein